MTAVIEVLENAGGAAMIVGTVILRSLVASRYRRWNTIDPIGFVTTRKMLLGIKQRAEDSRFVVQS